MFRQFLEKQGTLAIGLFHSLTELWRKENCPAEGGRLISMRWAKRLTCIVGFERESYMKSLNRFGVEHLR
jgi:hypothetical protein